MSSETKKARSEKELATRLSAVRKSINKTVEEYDVAVTKLEEEIENFNNLSQRAVFENCLKTEKPFVEFAKVFYFTGKRFKEERDKETNKLIDVSIDDTKKRLSLSKFIKYSGFSEYTEILNAAGKLRQLLIIREQNICKLTHAQLAKESPFFVRTVRAKEEGKTPDSNTQICKAIQAIMDSCGVECKIINPDLHFIQQCAFTHDGRNKCTIKPVTETKFTSIMVDVMNHFVEGTEYSVFVKENKKDA